MSANQIAVLIDGGFFLKRIRKELSSDQTGTPDQIAKTVRRLSFNHVTRLTGDRSRYWQQHLYRTFFYDAEPYKGVAHHPIANRQIEFAKSDIALERQALFERLKRERKLALRLGKVNRENDWVFDPKLTKDLLRTKRAFEQIQPLLAAQSGAEETPSSTTLQLNPEQVAALKKAADFWQNLRPGDVALGLRQKGVDMRIAIDIASLTLKKQVKTIVLVAGDSDFVPAAKLARREGIEFILDPLWQNVNDDLFEHIDALQSGLKRPPVNGQGAAEDAVASLALPI